MATLLPPRLTMQDILTAYENRDLYITGANGTLSVPNPVGEEVSKVPRGTPPAPSTNFRLKRNTRDTCYLQNIGYSGARNLSLGIHEVFVRPHCLADEILRIEYDESSGSYYLRMSTHFRVLSIGQHGICTRDHVLGDERLQIYIF